MRHSLRSRAIGLLLTLLFMGGVGATSDLDALLFHRAGAGAASGAPHVEAGAGCHAERCLLAFRVASGRLAPPLDPVIRFEGMPLVDAGSRPASPPRRIDAAFYSQPRAPPASFA